jgi:hypothetical protein
MSVIRKLSEALRGRVNFENLKTAVPEELKELGALLWDEWELLPFRKSEFDEFVEELLKELSSELES